MNVLRFWSLFSKLKISTAVKCLGESGFREVFLSLIAILVQTDPRYLSDLKAYVCVTPHISEAHETVNPTGALYSWQLTARCTF